MERRVRSRGGSGKRYSYYADQHDQHKRLALPQEMYNGAQSSASIYFTGKSVLVFLWLAASLLVLPLILPPLPPPPFSLLLVPIGLLGLLMVFAFFMPSDATTGALQPPSYCL